MSSSHRQILRATSIVGGAAAANIVIGLMRNKAAALLLGPVGVGTIGLLLNLVQTAASLAALGIGSSAVREIARGGEPAQQLAVRVALQRLTIVLALVGAAAMWLLRETLARRVLGDPSLAGTVGWMAPAVALTVWSGSQVALLNGLRRLRDLALTQVLGALGGTVLGIAAIALWRERGIVPYIVAAPLTMALAGLWFTSHSRPAGRSERTAWLAAVAPMLRLGVPLMLGTIALSVGLLTIRALIGDRVGAVALGEFTAAWTISVTYVGFILQAMGTDYYPRLTTVIDDHDAAGRAINDQIEVGLLLALPIMLGMQALALLLVRLLYSSQFDGAISALRWLIVADVLKVTSLPLGFVLMAQARAKTFLAIEVVTLGVTLLVTSLLVESRGIEAAGIGYSVSYLFYLVVVSINARRRIGMHLGARQSTLLLTSLLLTSGVAIVASAAPAIGMIGGFIAAALAMLFSIRRMQRLEMLPQAVSALIDRMARRKSTTFGSERQK